MGTSAMAWRFRLRGYFYAMELYTRQGKAPKSLEEAAEAADDQYPGEWTEVYNGVEGANQEDVEAQA